MISLKALLVVALGCGGGGGGGSGGGSGPAPAPTMAQPTTTTSMTTCAGVSADAAARMQGVVRDPQKRFGRDDPDAPLLTCPILQGLDAELADASVRARYESLSIDHWADHSEWADTIASLGRDSRRYTLVALSTHWNTDMKIHALRALQRVPSRLLINTDAAGQSKLAETERAALRFLIHVVETTPRVIAGSESSTIHGIYIDELIRMIEMLSGERGPDGAVRTNQMTEPQFAAALASWRRAAGL